MTALAEQCEEALPPEALEAIRLFNAGEYHHQHDLFEELWRAESRPVRDLYQGVLQVGLAYYQITRGNLRGALKMFQRSERWLAPLPDVCRGINVAKLRADAARVKAEVRRLGAERIDQFDPEWFEPVEVVNDAE